MCIQCINVAKGKDGVFRLRHRGLIESSDNDAQAVYKAIARWMHVDVRADGSPIKDYVSHVQSILREVESEGVSYFVFWNTEDQNVLYPRD